VRVRPILVLAIATALIAIVVAVLGLGTGVREVGEHTELLMLASAGTAAVLALYLVALDLIAGERSLSAAPSAIAVSVLVLVALGIAVRGGSATAIVAAAAVAAVVAVSLPIAGGWVFARRRRAGVPASKRRALSRMFPTVRAYPDSPSFVSMFAVFLALAAMGGGVAVAAVASSPSDPEPVVNMPVGEVLDADERRELRDLVLQLQEVAGDGDDGPGLVDSMFKVLGAGGSIAEMIGLVRDVRGAGSDIAKDMLSLLVTAAVRKASMGGSGGSGPTFAPTFKFDGGDVSIGGVELTFPTQPQSQADCRPCCEQICPDREPKDDPDESGTDESGTGSGLPPTR
jgi:hypothetical protein